MRRTYDKPVVRDYGSLVEMTQATALFDQEDGAMKLIPLHHSQPVSP